jgi:hypothetical protein
MRATLWRLSDAGQSQDKKSAFAQQSGPALPIKKYAAKYGVHPSTVWRALRDGRLEYVIVNKRKLVLPPIVKRNSPLK